MRAKRVFEWMARPWVFHVHVPLLCSFIALSGGPARAHPHVFIDGGVSFEFEGTNLVSLSVNWLYDEFETLYILSSYELSLNDEGALDEVDRKALVQHRSEWPSDFDGSAHLSIEGELVALEWPKALDAFIVDGRLRITFTRDLEEPVDLMGLKAEVAFYESTYFYAFSVTEQPALIGAGSGCSEEVKAYDPTVQDQQLQTVLSRLGREETPTDNNVGLLFADRIVVTCE